MAVSTITSTQTAQDKREKANKKRRVERAKAEKKPRSGGLFSKLRDKRSADRDVDKHFLIDPYPTYYTPSFIHRNGKVAAIVQLYVRAGSNRELYYDDILDLIPVNPSDGVTIHLLSKDTSLTKAEKKMVIRDNAYSNKRSIANEQTHGNDRDKADSSRAVIDEADQEDYNEYELILDSAEPVICSTIELMVVGPDEETVQEQIDTINTSLDQRHEGLHWDSLGGDQEGRLHTLFAPVPKDRFHLTLTGTNWAGINFAANSGLADPHGLPVGIDALALTNTTAYFDFAGTLDSQGVIAIPRSAVMHTYATDSYSPPVASLIAQAAANQVVMNGGRAHHLVLNKFNYLEDGRYYRTYNEAFFDKYDVAKMTINPLQGFGSLSEVGSVYHRLTQKIVNIFNVLQNLQLSKEDYGIVLKAVRNFYVKQGLWDENGELYPGRTRIVEITNPETYPTLGSFINEFTTSARRALKNNQEMKASSIETLQAILDQALSAHRQMLGRPTSIKPSHAPQVYYDFGSIETSNIRQVQYLNLLDYIIYTAKPGDVIVIHGTEHLWLEVFKNSADTIKAAQNNGIRFIFAFDTITSTAQRGIDRADVFSMQGTFFKDMDSGVELSWSIVGRCLPEEVQNYEKAMSQELSDIVRSQMQSRSPCRALIHRSRGDVNNFVNLHVII